MQTITASKIWEKSTFEIDCINASIATIIVKFKFKMFLRLLVL